MCPVKVFVSSSRAQHQGSALLTLCEALGIPDSRVRVIKTTLGGSFGGKGQPTLEPICAYLSYQLKKPVKLVMDRTESIIGTRTRTKTIGTVKTAVDKEGNILARDIHMLVDAGAYLTNGSTVAMAMGKKAFKLYRIKNQRYSATSVYTNTPIGGAARGYGSPQLHALTEINIDNVARRLGMDPVELRLRNLSVDIKKAYEVLQSGKLLADVREAMRRS